DFLSVGSNDLAQFFYAADRGNKRVADRFDPLSAPLLRALRDITAKAEKHGKPVTLCGELASQPIGALALAAIGFRSLSLAPTAVGPVKAMLLELDAGKAAAMLNPLLDSPAGSVSIREKLKAFAVANGLQILDSGLPARSVTMDCVPEAGQAEQSAGLAQKPTFAQEMPHLRRCLAMQRNGVQAAQDDVIALAGQVRPGERDNMVPRRRDDPAIEIGGRREPVHIAVGMRAELRCGGAAPAEQPQPAGRTP